MDSKTICLMYSLSPYLRGYYWTACVLFLVVMSCKKTSSIYSNTLWLQSHKLHKPRGSTSSACKSYESMNVMLTSAGAKLLFFLFFSSLILCLPFIVIIIFFIRNCKHKWQRRHTRIYIYIYMVQSQRW